MEPVEQAGVMNYMPSEMVTVPKIAKSSPDTNSKTSLHHT